MKLKEVLSNETLADIAESDPSSSGFCASKLAGSEPLSLPDIPHAESAAYRASTDSISAPSPLLPPRASLPRPSSALSRSTSFSSFRTEATGIDYSQERRLPLASLPVSPNSGSSSTTSIPLSPSNVSMLIVTLSNLDNSTNNH